MELPLKNQPINQKTQRIRLSAIQPLIGFAIILFITIYSSFISNISNKLSLYLLTGVILGYILTRSRFGFAGGVKRIYVTGEGSLTKALLLMFALTMVGMAGIHWSAAATGAVPEFIAAAGDAIIPGSGSVKALSIATILGGFLFGVGMIMSGGCASGTLTDVGEGFGRAAIVLFFFVLGAAPGHWMRYEILESPLGKYSTTLYLPDAFGYIGALLLSLLALLFIYVLVRKYESFRKKEGFYQELEYEEDEKPLKDDGSFKLFSFNTYHKLFIERWSFYTGGIMLAIMFIFIINTTGSSWGVTSEFTKWNVALLQNFGADFSHPAFTSIVEEVEGGLLNDNGTMRNIGIVLGSVIALLLAGKFKFDFDFRKKDVVIYACGGVLMGLGARIAAGCNLGALFAAIGNFSIAGWAFLIAITIGGIAGLKIFEGRLNIIPPNRYKK